MTESIDVRVEASRHPKQTPTHLAHVLADRLDSFQNHLYDTTDDEELRERIRVVLAKGKTVRWPSAKYKTDPVGFVEDVLGFQLTDDQTSVLLAITKHRRVAVKSGHKIGMSTVAAVAALWFYCTHAPCRVVFTSKTTRQVN